MSKLVEAFATQLQIFIQIRDQVFQLFTVGHFDFQIYRREYKFQPDGLAALMTDYHSLHQKTTEWEMLVSNMRHEFYFLNYFTMKEILEVANILKRVSGVDVRSPTPPPASKSAPSVPSSAAVAAAPVAPPPASEPEVEIPTMYTCEACTYDNPVRLAACEVCGTSRPAAITKLLGVSAAPARPAAARAAAPAEPAVLSEKEKSALRIVYDDRSDSREKDPVKELTSFFHLIASKIKEASTAWAIHEWHQLVESTDATTLFSASHFLPTLGRLLDQSFKSVSVDEIDEKSGAVASPYVFSVRDVPPPGADAKNSHDSVIVVEDGKGTLPIFCAQTEIASDMIGVVLSVYVRRKRLPEPGTVSRNYLINSLRVSCLDIDMVCVIVLFQGRFCFARRKQPWRKSRF